jgi:hypothetical protein
MRPPLLIALAVALGATLWLQQGEDTSGVELAERRDASRSKPADQQEGRSERPPHADASLRRTGRTDAGHGTRKDADRTPDAAGAWLVDRVQAWRAQRAEIESLPLARAMSSATPSGWAAALPPPPPAPKPERSADLAPVAPTFPHQWVGRFDDEASAGSKLVRRAVISGPVSTWVAREGDVIEGQWRVDQIQERLMRLTYLPLQQSQTVAMK